MPRTPDRKLITDPEQLPSNARVIAEQIEKLGFKWEFNDRYILPKSEDEIQRLQIRDTPHIAPTLEVNRYSKAMIAGDQFPPGVVTADGVFVDFNTRARAALKAGNHDFPVLILDVDYKNASQAEMGRLRVLGMALNTHHGNRLTRAEISKNVRELARTPDWTAKQVGNQLGLTPDMVGRIFNEVKAENRAKELGIVLDDKILTASARSRLGSRSNTLSDASFGGIATVALDAKLNDKEIDDLCRRVVAAPEADEAEIIRVEREQRGEQIRHFKATKISRPPLPVEVAKRLTFFNDLTDRLNEAVERNPYTRDEYARQIEGAIKVLTGLQAAQRRTAWSPES